MMKDKEKMFKAVREKKYMTPNNIQECHNLLLNRNLIEKRIMAVDFHSTKEKKTVT